MALETAASGMLLHPNPIQYELCGSDPEWPLGCGMFIAMSFTKEEGAFPGQTIDLRPAINNFMEVISQWDQRDLYAGQFKLRFKRLKRSEVPEYARDPEAARRRVKAGDTIYSASPAAEPSTKKRRV